ncbi:MAG: hypothetical protein CMN84_11350 [Spongiibacteraceae bacterium]|nr:hypothetical protein [Spongiibacteraceae bacterium]
MADSDDKRNFTDKLLSSDTNAKRVSEIEDQLDADTKEAYRLRHLADLQPMGMVSTGGYQAGNDSARGNGMEILLARRFFAAVERGDAITVLAYIRIGYDINIRRERLDDTALHIAAARDAKDVLKLLIESRQCDFLMRDNRGRLASEMAYLFGGNPAVARLLGNKERKQGKVQGVSVTRRSMV